MNDNHRKIYMPKAKKNLLLRLCSLAFCFGTVFMWVFKERLSAEYGDLLIMSGISLMLVTLSVNSRRAEKKYEAELKELEQIREKCGSDDYGNDMFFK